MATNNVLLFCFTVACFSLCLIKDVAYGRANLESLSKEPFMPRHEVEEAKIPLKRLHPARILSNVHPSTDHPEPEGHPGKHLEKNPGGAGGCGESGKGTTMAYPESLPYDTTSKAMMSSKPLGVGANAFTGAGYPQDINSKRSEGFQQRAAVVNDESINPNDIGNGGGLRK